MILCARAFNVLPSAIHYTLSRWYLFYVVIEGGEWGLKAERGIEEHFPKLKVLFSRESKYNSQ